MDLISRLDNAIAEVERLLTLKENTELERVKDSTELEQVSTKTAHSSNVTQQLSGNLARDNPNHGVEHEADSHARDVKAGTITDSRATSSRPCNRPETLKVTNNEEHIKSTGEPSQGADLEHKNLTQTLRLREQCLSSGILRKKSEGTANEDTGMALLDKYKQLKEGVLGNDITNCSNPLPAVRTRLMEAVKEEEPWTADQILELFSSKNFEENLSDDLIAEIFRKESFQRHYPELLTDKDLDYLLKVRNDELEAARSRAYGGVSERVVDHMGGVNTNLVPELLECVNYGNASADKRLLRMINKTIRKIEVYDDPGLCRMTVQLALAKKYIEDFINIRGVIDKYLSKT